MTVCRFLLVLSLLLFNLKGEGAVGKLVAGGFVLEAGEQWSLPADSVAVRSVEVRGRFLPDKKDWKKAMSWTVDLADGEGHRLARILVDRPKMVVRYDDYVPVGLSVAAHGYGGNGDACGELRWDNSGSKLGGDSWFTVSVVMTNKGMAEVLIGGEFLFSIGMIPVGGDVETVSMTTDGQVEIRSVNVRNDSRAKVPVLARWDMDALTERLSAPKDFREGIYEYLDSDIDPDKCRLGGRYRLALVADGKGGYDIVYLGGAEENLTMWRPGMIKGTLVPTIFQNHYDLTWYDTAMEDDMVELWGNLNGTLIELHFPLEQGTIRFRRVRQELSRD